MWWSRPLPQLVTALVVIAMANAGLLAAGQAQTHTVDALSAREADHSGAPSPTPQQSPTPAPTAAPTPTVPTPPPLPTAQADVPPMTAAPGPTDEVIGGAADPAEQKRIAASLTDGVLFESGGAYGARKTVEAGRTRLQIEVYPLGAPLKEGLQVYVHVWEPGLIRSSALDYGNGRVSRFGPSRHRLWACGDEDRPYPYHLNWDWGEYAEPGRYTLTATVETGSCGNSTGIDDVTDVHTVSASIDVELGRNRLIGAVN